MKTLFMALWAFLPCLLFAQQPTGVITYDVEMEISETTHQLKAKDHVSEAHLERIKKQVYGTKKRGTAQVYFSPTTACTYQFQGTAPAPQTRQAVTVIRSHSDVPYAHSTHIVMGEGLSNTSTALFATDYPTEVQQQERSLLENYQRSDATRQILGYTCYAYKNTENPNQVLWVTTELNLPSLYDAGLLPKGSHIKGVVLGRDSKGYTTVATRIELRKLNEDVLRNTPLQDLRPELLR